MDINEFRNKMKKRRNNASFLNWKDEGSLLFVVHPRAEIGERKTVRYERIVSDEDGKTDTWGCYRPFAGKDDFSVKFKNWLKQEDSIDNDDVVFRLTSDKKGTVEYSKGDLLGLSQDPDLQNKYSWKKNMLRPREEFLLCVRPYKSWDDGWQLLTLTPYTGEKWLQVVESQIEDYGEVKGNYVSNPYVFKITYDKSQPALNMYHVERTLHKLSDEMLASLKEDPIDVLSVADPSSWDTLDGGTVEDLIRAMCVVPCPLFEEVEREEVKQQATAQVTASQSRQQEETKPELPKQQQEKSSMFVKGEQFEYEGEVITFVKQKGDKYIFSDEDGLKEKLTVDDLDDLRSLKGGDDDIPFNKGGESLAEKFVEETLDADTGVKVKDCIKGKDYFTLEGQVVTFVKYLQTKNKGIFKIGDERITLDGGDYVSPSDNPPVDNDDPLAPIEDSNEEKEQQTEKTSGEMDTCGVCGAEIPSNAKKCDSCGAVFDFDEDDLPSFGLD